MTSNNDDAKESADDSDDGVEIRKRTEEFRVLAFECVAKTNLRLRVSQGRKTLRPLGHWCRIQFQSFQSSFSSRSLER